MQRCQTLALLFLSLAICSKGQTMPKVGDPAPPILVKHVLQAPVEQISEWRGLGDNAVVLEFWGTWCAPCVAAIPHLNDHAVRFKGRPVRFLAITDEEDWRVRNFLKLKPMASWIGLDTERAIFTAYGVGSLPLTNSVNCYSR